MTMMIMGHANYYKEKHCVGTGFQVQRFSPLSYGRKHRGMQSDMMLVKEPIFWHLDRKAAGRETDIVPDLSIWNLKAYPQ